MNIVLVIPTGIGCVIGGHAGDGNPVAKLMGACCDNLILHPNVVVRENQSVLHEYEDGDERFIFVENYMEAAGLIMSMKAGIHPSSVRRPLAPTTVRSAKP